MFSRRKVLWNLVAFAGLGIGVAIPSSAHAATPDKASDAEQRYEEAVNLLKRGRWLNLCATKLKDLSASAPQDIRYKIALGHTYASQCASLCYSLGITPKTPATDQDVQRYRNRLNDLMAAAKAKQTGKPDVPVSDIPETPAKPVASSDLSFVTVDDGRSVTMTREEFVAQLRHGFDDASS